MITAEREHSTSRQKEKSGFSYDGGYLKSKEHQCKYLKMNNCTHPSKVKLENKKQNTSFSFAHIHFNLHWPIKTARLCKVSVEILNVYEYRDVLSNINQ